ncbi:MAG: sodium:solute symporter [Planctomycetes bacterium]|nr:sodium:solute symporter [Planctomycetota bacterium]
MLVVLALYVGAQLALGLWIARRVQSEDDFLVAGRRLGPVLATVSIFATWFGAETCVGAAGSIYEDGLGWHSVEPFGYGLCLLLLGALFAARLWRTGVTTVADLFGERFGGSAARIAAVLMVPTSLLWAGAQIRAFGHVLAANSDGLFGLEAALWIAAAIVIVYTSAGGLLADVVTDLVQGIALTLGLIALLIGVVAQLGGIGAAVDAVAARLPERAPEPLGPLEIAELWAIPVFGSLAAQEIVSRTLAARSPGLARRAGLLGGGLYVLVGLIPVTLGLLGRVVADVEDPEQLLPTLANAHMPRIVNLLFAGALVSAMLSTVDSCLLAASSVLTRNLVGSLGARSPRGKLLAARVTAVACGLAAFAIAHEGDSVSDLVEEASGFGSAGIFVLFCLALRGRPGRWSAAAANGCLLGGAAAWIVGRYVLDAATPFLWSLAFAIAGLALGAMLRRRR